MVSKHINKRSFRTVFTVSTLLLAGGILFSSFTPGSNHSLLPSGMFLDKQQEQKALVLLNKVRKDPNAYSARFGASLRGIAPRPELQWNDSLAVVAERKAWSMASRGYFGHVDPEGNGINYYINKSYPLADDQLTDKKLSNLEAIQGGAPSGEGAVKDIVINFDKEDATGRQLVLGEGDFNGSLTDVGIGYVHATTSNKYETYTVIILAKRK